MGKSILFVLGLLALSLAVVTLTRDNQIIVGTFALHVPDQILSAATYTLGISTTIIIPVLIKAWLANKYNITMNAGLQDMKLTHVMQQNQLLLDLAKEQMPYLYKTPKNAKDKLTNSIQKSSTRTAELSNTYSNYATVNPDQKRTYIQNQISVNDGLLRNAERINDSKTVKHLRKIIKNNYGQLRKL